MTNKQEVEFKIGKVKLKGALKKYEKDVKDKLLHSYTIEKAKELEALERSTIIDFDFERLIILSAERLQKIAVLDTMVISLERHKYAPEMNCLHFKSGKTYRVKGHTDITEAKLYAAISMSYADIEKYKHEPSKHSRRG